MSAQQRIRRLRRRQGEGEAGEGAARREISGAVAGAAARNVAATDRCGRVMPDFIVSSFYLA